MISIRNVRGPLDGKCRYIIEIYGKDTKQTICTFTHNRPDGLAECLKKAAKAVEVAQEKRLLKIVETLNNRDRETL